MHAMRQLTQDFLFLASARQPCEPHQRTELKNVFFPGHRLVLLAELPCESLAAVDIVRADKVARDLDAIGQITDLFGQ